MDVLNQFKGSEVFNKGASKRKTKSPTFQRGIRVCAVPVTGLMLMAFGLLRLAVTTPSLRSASEFFSQLVEPGVPVSPTIVNQAFLVLPKFRCSWAVTVYLRKSNATA